MRAGRCILISAVALAVACIATDASAQQDLARARALDKEGAKAYADGRYNDAIRYFQDAYKLGGPPFELWNVARCHLKLDQPEQAAETLEKYLATPNLPPDDQREASGQLEALRKRPSTLSVGSSPPGATVTVDGNPAPGKTPTSSTLAPGNHTVVVSMANHATYTKEVEARYGRAVILDVALADAPPAGNAGASQGSGGGAGAGGAGAGAPGAGDGGAAEKTPEAPSSDAGFDPAQHVSLRGGLGVVLPRFGEVGGDASPGLFLAGTYRFFARGSTALGAGVLARFTADSWDNNVDRANTAAPCGLVSNDLSGSALSFLAVVDGSWEIVRRLRAVAMIGGGLATYSGGHAGGDLFVANCSLSPGTRGVFGIGVEVDYAITKRWRAVALPLLLELHSGFDGARQSPLDATGLWTRATLALGVGADL